MSNKDVTPKVHLFDKLDKLHDKQLILIVLPDGRKLRTTVMELKEFMNLDVLKELKGIEERIKDTKLTKDSIIEAFKRSNAISFGKPLNILADVGIEKKKTKGIIYSDGKRVRINLNGKWRTFKLEDD